MANRRFSGGINKLGHGGHNFPQQQPVSPWQGGSAPNALNPGLLSHLSAPQAQLALAITSLLQSPQQQQTNPPSLLSLNTSPAFNNQDSFGNRNRFANRTGRDFRRSEPYNKNRGGSWRSEGSSFRGNSNYGNKNRNHSRTNFGPRKQNDPKGKARFDNRAPVGAKAPKSDESFSKEAVKNETLSEANREVFATPADVKKKEVKEETKGEEFENESPGKSPEKRPRDGKYSGVPQSLLHCFVCNKSMWDGESFQNHLRGKAHKQMMDSLEESCQITVNIMRENMRLAEEKKMIELERMHRNNRNFHRKPQEPQSHCNMCDLKFLGKIISHRKTEGHQRLKRFLHPKCEPCNKEFPSRMEWIDHRFTPEHLQQMHVVMEQKTGQECGSMVEEDVEINLEPLLGENLQMEDENPVLELSDDMKDLHNRIPAYKSNRAIGKECVQQISGYYCDICDRFLVADDILEAHLKSEKHYLSFIQAAKCKYQKLNETQQQQQPQQQQEQQQEEEEEESGDISVFDTSSALDTTAALETTADLDTTADVNTSAAEATEDESDAKRAKLEEKYEHEPAANGQDLYDPEEACDEQDPNALQLSHDNEEALLLDDDDKRWADVDAVFSGQEIVASELPEVKVVVEPTVPVTKPAIVQRVLRRTGAVRNGAGPKSRRKAPMK